MTTLALEIQQLSKHFGRAVPADKMDLFVEKGEFFTLLGPSGSGKSTVLRMVAGLERPDSGNILIDGESVTNVPPWKRGLGMVFQQYANFPHMNVSENIAYGLRHSQASKMDIAMRVESLLNLVGLVGFQDRKVAQLSGGEQQRVAIARALAPSPRLLLLDEPLSALDEKIRREMQIELRNIQRSTGTTFIYVTHDQEEALTMSDRIAVLNHGKCVQCDKPEAIFRKPRTRFVANFFRGCNVIEGQLALNGGTTFSIAGQKLRLNDLPSLPIGPCAAAIRGETLQFIDQLGKQLDDSYLLLPARLERVTYRGIYSDYQLTLEDGQQMSATLPHQNNLVLGQAVSVKVKASDIVFLDND
jgi:ABC-type Fe3+/spermidine/putrescine transport system ATPase subunit